MNNKDIDPDGNLIYLDKGSPAFRRQEQTLGDKIEPDLRRLLRESEEKSKTKDKEIRSLKKRIKQLIDVNSAQKGSEGQDLKKPLAMYLNNKITELMRCQRKECGNFFKPVKPWQAYCSVACRNSDWREKHEHSFKSPDGRMTIKVRVKPSS